MIVIKLKCDKSIREKFRVYGIDRAKLENFLNYHTNNLVPTRKWWVYDLSVKGIPGADSQYFWDDDEIEVATRCYDCSTKKQRRIYFLSSLVHEYRHWVQCKLQRVSAKKLDYSEDDIAKRSDAYTKNPYELECVEWENLVATFNEFI